MLGYQLCSCLWVFETFLSILCQDNFHQLMIKSNQIKSGEVLFGCNGRRMKLRVGESRGLEAGFEKREELKPGVRDLTRQESSIAGYA
jgi:hypothetical protein